MTLYAMKNHASGRAPAEGEIDPSKLRRAYFDDLAAVAARNSRRRVDAGDVSLFVQQELEQMEAMVKETARTPLTAFDHIPMRTGHVSPGARSVAYKQITRAGKASWLGSKQTDKEKVEVGARKFDAPARMFGLAYSWDIEDVLESMFTGASLPTEEAIAARQAFDEFLNDVGWFGGPSSEEPESDWYGLLNNPHIQKPEVGVTLDSNSTASAILAMLHAQANAIVDGTGGIERPTRLLLPIAEHNYIATTEMSTDSGTTIKERFLQQSPYIKEVFGCPELSGAGDDSGNVGVFLNPSLDKLALDISLGMTHLELQRMGLEFVQQVIGKVVRLRVFRPRSIRIIQGI